MSTQIHTYGAVNPTGLHRPQLNATRVQRMEDHPFRQRKVRSIGGERGALRWHDQIVLIGDFPSHLFIERGEAPSWGIRQPLRLRLRVSHPSRACRPREGSPPMGGGSPWAFFGPSGSSTLGPSKWERAHNYLDPFNDSLNHSIHKIQILNIPSQKKFGPTVLPGFLKGPHETFFHFSETIPVFSSIIAKLHRCDGT